MRAPRSSLLLGAVLLTVPLAASGLRAGAASPTGLSHREVPVCASAPGDVASCNSIVYQTVSSTGQVVPNVAPSGYGPVDLRSAYDLGGLPDTRGTGQTIGIVDAYNDPNVETDLATYRETFGLGECSTDNGCLRVVNQDGGTTLPRDDGGWAQEISLDVDMASAICPSCDILLVEASSASMTDLGTAVNEAVELGAHVVSNSYGGRASRFDATFDTSYFKHPGVAITASTGDSGYGVEYPAASQYVTAVGGTSLQSDSTTDRGWTETAWSGSGSGCSKYDVQPSWQTLVTPLSAACDHRALADVSAVADPRTGVAVYDSFRFRGMSGWLVFGGTSVSSPIIAAIYALAQNATSIDDASHLYGNVTGNFNDVTSGRNGHCRTVLCNAGTGWDGPTGLGTPNGIGAF